MGHAGFISSTVFGAAEARVERVLGSDREVEPEQREEEMDATTQRAQYSLIKEYTLNHNII